MKNIFLAASLLLIGSVTLAQNKTHTEEPSRPIRNNSSKVVEMKSMYIFERDQMIDLFKEKSIASDFPAYNYALSREENVKNVKSWAVKSDNKSLLTLNGTNKLNSLYNEFK